MFRSDDILYEDNHLMVVNKRSGDLVQPDPSGASALEDQIKNFIKIRDNKQGNVFLGVVHRVDRPVSGTVIFAKTGKSLLRLNEMIRDRQITKKYWAITENAPVIPSATVVHHIVRNAKTNRSQAFDNPTAQSKEAKLIYKVLCHSSRYHLLEVELITGRHHQIRSQLAKIGCPIKGDLKYGAARSNPDGGISLHARSLSFMHPVKSKETLGFERMICVVAPVPEQDNLWTFFAKECE